MDNFPIVNISTMTAASGFDLRSIQLRITATGSICRNIMCKITVNTCLHCGMESKRYTFCHRWQDGEMCVSYPSLTHAAVVAFVFECINAHCGWTTRVRLEIIMDPATECDAPSSKQRRPSSSHHPRKFGAFTKDTTGRKH
jgi:hypothetical protein